MKRRNFIKGTSLGVMGVPAVATGSSFYGTPDSVIAAPIDPDVLIATARLGLPKDVTTALAEYGSVWADLLRNPSSAVEFFRDQEGFLARRGLPVLDYGDSEIKLLRLLCNPRTKGLVDSGDTKALLQLMASSGFTTDFSTQIGARVSQMMKLHGERLKTHFEELAVRMKGLDLKTAEFTPEELDLLLLGISSSSQKACTVFAVCAAVVAVALHAAISLGVVAIVGVAVAVATMVSEVPIVVQGTGFEPQKIDALVNRLTAYDPLLAENFNATVKLEHLANAPGLALDFLRLVVRTEARAVMECAEQLQLLTLAPEYREGIMALAERTALRTTGLG